MIRMQRSSTSAYSTHTYRLLVCLALVATLSSGASVSTPKQASSEKSNQHSPTGVQGGNAAAGDKAVSDRRQGAPGRYMTTECTSSVPAALSLLGLDNICADIDLASCGSNVTFGLRWKSQRPPNYLVRETLDMTSQEECGQPSEFASTALASVCGPSAKLCVTFLDASGANTLSMGPGFAAGCPIIDIKDCRMPLTGQLSSFALPLDCFSDGQVDCRTHTSCDTCIESGCGWCTSGYKSEFACMPGDRYGPVCDVCGQGGGCNWNYGVCPMEESELIRREQMLNQTRKDLDKANTELAKLREDVKGGAKVSVDSTDYECKGFGSSGRARSGAVAVAVISSLLCLFTGMVAGGFLGKAGHVDKLLSFSRLKEVSFSGAAKSSESAYVPPDL